VTGTGCTTSNCIAVDGNTTLNPIFGKAVNRLLGTYAVHAHAQAYVGPPGYIKNLSVAPLPISQACVTPPDGNCTLPKTVTLDFGTAANLLYFPNASPPNCPVAWSDLPPAAGGTLPTNVMESYITSGYPCAVPTQEWYGVDNGQHDGLKQAFKAMVGQVMLIPVYDLTWPIGSTAQAGNVTSYHVVGFSGFKITSVDSWNNGQGKVLTGDLVRWRAEGLPAGPGQGKSFGVFVVGLDG